VHGARGGCDLIEDRCFARCTMWPAGLSPPGGNQRIDSIIVLFESFEGRKLKQLHLRPRGLGMSLRPIRHGIFLYRERIFQISVCTATRLSVRTGTPILAQNCVGTVLDLRLSRTIFSELHPISIRARSLIP